MTDCTGPRAISSTGRAGRSPCSTTTCWTCSVAAGMRHRTWCRGGSRSRRRPPARSGLRRPPGVSRPGPPGLEGPQAQPALPVLATVVARPGGRRPTVAAPDGRRHLPGHPRRHAGPHGHRPVGAVQPVGTLPPRRPGRLHRRLPVPAGGSPHRSSSRSPTGWARCPSSQGTAPGGTSTVRSRPWPATRTAARPRTPDSSCPSSATWWTSSAAATAATDRSGSSRPGRSRRGRRR